MSVEENIKRIKTIITRLKSPSLHGLRKYSSTLYFKKDFLLPCPMQVAAIPKSTTKIKFVQKYAGDYIKTVNDDCILNFASAKHPGGGVLKGTTAQEEDICRNSLLYLYLREFQDKYDIGKFKAGVYYTDFAIYSPDVFTVNEDYQLTTKNNYITSAAPNLSDLSDYNVYELKQTWYRRVLGILSIAYIHGCKKITLGPWGCGVFKNDPYLVEEVFYDLIKIYGGNFEQITFLTPDDYHLEIFSRKLKNLNL